MVLTTVLTLVLTLVLTIASKAPIHLAANAPGVSSWDLLQLILYSLEILDGWKAKVHLFKVALGLMVFLNVRTYESKSKYF